MARSNRYAADCSECGTPVPAHKGTLTGPPWRTYCTACMPKDDTVRAEVSLGAGDTIEIRLVGYAGSAFNAYKRAVASAKAEKRSGGWVNVASMADAPDIVAALRNVDGISLRVAHEATERIALVMADRLAEADAALAAQGGSLYDYQRAGVPWLAERAGAILGDDMGLGKTLQALLAAREGAPIVVVCPAVAKGVWVREAAKWRPDLTPCALKGRGSFRWPKVGEMVVTNYDILPAEVPADTPSGCVLILDEGHAVKNGKAARTIRARALGDAARDRGGSVWVLTATPLLGKPQELWSLMRAAGTCPFTSFKEYMRLMGWEQTYNPGARRMLWEPAGEPSPEVAERLRGVMLRRMKSEVLTDLPEKRYREIVVNGLKKRTRKTLDGAFAQWGDDPDKLPPFEEMSEARAELAEAKIPALLELVDEYAEAGEPLVVFSAHRAPIDTLGERDGWATITGDTPPERRSEIEARFQAGELAGVAATIQAGGVAITLTRAAHAVFCDRDWTPALNSQAEDRIYRIGQSRGVLITTLVADHPLDKRLTTILGAKQALISATVDAARRDAEAIEAREAIDLDAYAADLDGGAQEAREAAARLAELDERAREREWQRTVAATSERRQGVETVESDDLAPRREAESERERWAARAVETLTLLDPDRAFMKNDVGWNQADGALGRLLFSRLPGGLTEQEWRLAEAVCAKYWRQIGRRPER